MVDPVSVDYGFTGGWQRFDVPHLTKVVQITAWGGGAGAQQGGRVRGKVRVEGSDAIYILVGEHGRGGGGGQNGGGATTGGGGPGGSGGSPSRNGGQSGGGGTWVRLNGSQGEIICVAGGAGGTSG